VPTHPDDEAPTAAGPAAIRCDHCGVVIGVYEPLVMVQHGRVLQHGRVRETSRAKEPALPLRDTTYYHRACYAVA